MTIQQLFESTKEFIIKDKSSENWIIYSIDIPKELHMIILTMNRKDRKEFDKLCQEFIL